MDDDDDELISELAFTLEEDDNEKLAQEREKLQRPDSASSNEYESQVKLQQAMLRRQELLDRIRQEQLLNDEEKRPRTYTPRRRYTPSPLPPPSRRSLPDLNRTYHFNWYNKKPRDMAVTKHVIEHQFHPVEPKTYTVLPAIAGNQQVPHVTTIQTPQPVIQQLPLMTYDGGQQNKNTFFNKSGISKSDFMDMMMLQNAQMHHMVMQQMMLQNLPGGGWRLPTAQVPLAPVVEPAVRAPPMMTYGAPAAPVIHHYQSVPPLDIRGGGFGGGRGAVLARKAVKNRPNNGPIVIRTDVVSNSRQHNPFPGSKALWRFRHIAWAAWFIAILRTLANKVLTR